MRGSPLTISTMRDTKFRIWEIDKSSFQIISFPHDMYKIIDSNGNYPKGHFDEFTGLTDIEGVEIYEGDIIKSVGNEEHNGMVGIFPIEFNSGMFSLSYQTIRLDYFLKYYAIEVIGNIHQNPELLK